MEIIIVNRQNSLDFNIESFNTANVLHENYLSNSNLTKSNELSRYIQLFRDLDNNQIPALPPGIFDRLIDLQRM
jgi:uncharacterized protein YcbK (DUF882 family)